MKHFRAFSPFPVAIIVAGLSAAGLVAGISAKTNATAAPAPMPAAQAGATYVGEAICSTCHITQNKQFTHTQHAIAFRQNPKNELQARSCEACHGPGSEHIKDPANPANRGALVGFTREWGTPVQKQTSMCLTCHQGGQQMFWPGSTHATQNMSCSDCHNPMARHSDSGLLKKPSINETCYTCHQTQRAEFAKRSHMPLPEGKVSCVDCHNPHGSPSKALIKSDSVNELCYTCHTEKRGPFLWEHAPVRDNCLNCHNAHGSNHDKLLAVARPFSCQQCHGNPAHQGTLYTAGQLIGGGGGPSTRTLGRSCQNCHVQIHGSNHPAGARFQR